MTRNQALVVVLAIGIVQVCAYWIAGLTASSDGTFPIAQPDTLLYCQAARRIVEGAPLSFSIGSAPCSGTTSVAYPFLLAVPYALGCTGDSLLTAGFVLNALFYLVFLAGWCAAVWKWLADDFSRMVAAVGIALCGHSAYSALTQSDIGCWLAMSGALLLALTSGRLALLALALAVAPWIRPEGMVVTLAFAGVLVVRLAVDRFCGRTTERRASLLTVAAIGLASLVAVFVFNRIVCGDFQFSSVAHKGYFKNGVFAAAVIRTVADGFSMLHEMFFGLSGVMPRNLVTPNLLGGVLLGIGVCIHDWNRSGSWRLAVWMVASLGGFLTVAMSGWQGTNFDRYVAWITPLIWIFMAEGAVWAFRRIPSRVGRILPVAALLAFAFGGAVVFVAFFNRNSAKQSSVSAFAKCCEAQMEPGASVGLWGNCGLAYFMTPRHIAHLSAIYSPEYAYMTLIERLDDLKLHPDLRFDYWVTAAEFADKLGADGETEVFGPCVLAGPANLALRKADWSAFDRTAVQPSVPGKSCVARIDVGFPPEERAHDYHILDRYDRPMPESFAAFGKRDGKRAVEAGRIVCGMDEMSVPLEPGKDVVVVMRTLRKAESPSTDGLTVDVIKGEVPAEIAMNVAIDGQIVSRVAVKLPEDKDELADVSFAIPGAAIVSPNPRVAFLGDHIVCGYWFYQ